MNKKQISYILLAVILLVIVTFFLYFSTFVQPKIVFTPQINKISSEEYKTILNNGQVLPDKSIEKFRNINLQVKVITPIGLIKNVDIEDTSLKAAMLTSELNEYIKKNNNIQILDNSFFGLGSNKEYTENINVYLKNMTESDLKNIIGNFKVRISWENVWGSQDFKLFYLKDYLK